VKSPEKAINAATCFEGCHETVKMLHTRGAHTKVNCGMCHEVVNPEHAKSPSLENRPTVRTDHRACATCHDKQLDSMMDLQYHMKWAARDESPSYNNVPDAEGNYLKLVQARTPRIHISLLADIAVNRTLGRYKYINQYDVNKPVERLWDKVYDAHPEDGNTLVPHETGLAWRPHKTPNIIVNAICLKCKTADTILDYAYLGVPHENAPLQRDTPALPLLTKVNTGINCVFCHDPHSAEPRVINDMIIEALIEPEYKDNAFQSNPEFMPKIEVVTMGERGYDRKIVILDRYDSNFMCGQCHSAPNGHVALRDSKTGELIGKQTIGSPYTTTFRAGPIETYEHYKKLGLYAASHPVTKTKYVPFTHPQMELASQSVHAKAGVTCTTCHYAKEDGYSSHQVSLPKEKVDKTCLRSDCHGVGTAANWKTPAEALYAIELIQQKGKLRIKVLDNAISNAVAFMDDANNKGLYKVDPAKMAVLDDKLGQAMTVEFWWFTDYSLSFHNPQMHEDSVTTTVKELNAALADAKSGAKPTVK
jgi:hypothetical protein